MNLQFIVSTLALLNPTAVRSLQLCAVIITSVSCGQLRMTIFLTVDKQETMEETILVGDDLMRGPPSPVIPKEIASHVLEGVELCDGILRNLFLCE